MIECPAPGIYRDIPDTQYHKWDAASASLLKTVSLHGPKRARYEQLHQKDPTPAMIFGTRAHTFLLEPDKIDEKFTKPLDVPRRSVEQKKAHENYEKVHAGKDFLKPDAFTKFRAMADEMHGRADWRELWDNRIAVELCVVWDDEETGLRMKCRIDLLTKYMGCTLIVDYKTTSNASAWHFGRAIWDYGYDIQANQYLAAAESIAHGDRDFALAAQEKTPPFDAMIHSLDPPSKESGRIRWRQAVTQWAACLEADEFPGYRQGVGEISMPSYAINLMEI